MPIYEERIVTRGYEADNRRTVPLTQYLSYLEHLRWEWLRDERLGLEPLIHDGHFFVVREQVLELVRRVKMKTPLILQGWLEHVGRGVVKVRHQALRERDGALVVDARVEGVWLGPTRRPARLPDAVRAMVAEGAPARGALRLEEAQADDHQSAETSFFEPPQPVFEPRGLDVHAPPKAEAPPAGAWKRELVVLPTEMDIFDHVNAVTYLRYFEDTRVLGELAGALPEGSGGVARRVAIAYHREALMGDRLVVGAWPSGEGSLSFVLWRQDEPAPLCTARIDV